MFDPTVGRWFQEDLQEFEAGDANLYRYVGNTPTNLTDPSGLEQLEWKPTPDAKMNGSVCGTQEKNNANKLVNTAVDRNVTTDTVIEQFCDGGAAQFIYRVRIGGVAALAGWCVFPAGVNRSLVEFDTEGRFKRVVHYNIGPIGKNNDALQQNNNQINTAITKALDALPKNPKPTLDQEQEAVLGVLRTNRAARIRIAEIKNGKHTLDVLMFVSDFTYEAKQTKATTTIYRLYYDENAEKMEWKIDDGLTKKLLQG